MAKREILLAAAATVLAIPAAHACSVIVDHEPDYFERKAEAKRILSFATLVVDGEVIEPSTPTTPARIKVARVLRGPPVDYVLIGQGDSCDIPFQTRGERWRFVLEGGPEIYTTWVDYSYAREIDRLLGSDRRKDWPLYNPEFLSKPKKR